MKTNPFHTLYAQIAALAALTIIVALSIKNQNGSVTTSWCAVDGFKVVPYILFHWQEVCGSSVLMILIAAYYAAATAIIIAAQMYYLRGRGVISINDRRALAIACLILFVFVLGWISGKESSSSTYSAAIHKGDVIFHLAAAVVIPSFQFIISILLLRGARD